MYDAPAFGTAVPDECAAPTTQHIAIRAAPEDRERADGDFTEAVDADLLWSHPRIRRKRSARVGRVLRQSPRAGAVKPKGAKVNLTVARR